MPAKRTKKKRRGDRDHGPANERGAEESRGVEALTVLWMMTALATLIAETVAAAVAVTALAPWGTQPGASLLGLLPGVMLFTALVTGAICLALMPLVLRLRRTPPPRGVVVVTLVIGVSPWLLLAGFFLRG